MTRSLAIGIFLLTAWLASAQQPPPAAKTSSIAGTVVKEPGSEPLKKVLVQVIAEHQGESYTASTDTDGHFRVDKVALGRYNIFFEKTGFAGVNARGLKSDTNVLTVQAGQPLEDLLFRMLPTAVISGRVTDEDGDPLHEVRMFVQRKKPGKATREGVGMAGTNDLGEYRVAGLFPGEYWIVAMPPPDFRDYERQRDKSPDGNNVDKPDTRYVTTYYPGTYDPTQASAIKLKAGDEMPVNFTLVPGRTYRVRGTVVGVVPGQKSTIELLPKAGDAVRVNADEIGPDGQFEVRGVAPGPYVLRTSAIRGTQSLTAEQEINVVAADLDGLRLTPAPAFTISGHLHSEAASADLTPYFVNLRLADLPDDPGFFMSQDFFGGNATVDRLGNFEWKNVNSGNYIVQVYGGDPQSSYYLKSVTIGGRDVAAGFTASGPATVEVLVSSKAGIVEGTVVEKEKDIDDSHLAANATVVAVPEEKYRKIPNRFASGSTDQYGRFSIRGLAPGSYTLYAWLDLEDSVWRDADFLKSQEANGTAVKLDEGSDQQVELKLSAVDEEWR